jgi:cytoskeletal protein CcmA (bactofilin family)
MIFKNDPSEGDLNGFLDGGSQMQGELGFQDTFRIDGKFTGKIHSTGKLGIGEGGRIEGEVKVGTVLISGIVRGSVEASQRVEITKTGKVYGDLHTASLVIEDGALFEGQCTMIRAPEGKAEPARVVQALPLKKNR